MKMKILLISILLNILLINCNNQLGWAQSPQAAQGKV